MLLGRPHHAVCCSDCPEQASDLPRLALSQCHVPRHHLVTARSLCRSARMEQSAVTIRRVHSLNIFKRQLKTFLFAQAF